jgi:hypothetical protein
MLSFTQYINLANSMGNGSKLSILNPELKNLNLQAVQNIVLQRLVDQKYKKANQQFLRHRKAKYRSRLNTAV